MCIKKDIFSYFLFNVAEHEKKIKPFSHLTKDN